MTDDQINAAIAETCGWKCAGHPHQKKATDGLEFGYQIVIRPDGQLVTHNSIPDYCNDLNAMHEAEKVLSSPQRDEYWDRIKDLTDEGFDQLHATARQRAEAFLRTLGKWEEVQG